MIIELTIRNINLLQDSFLLKDDVKNEFTNNPFAKYLIYIYSNIIVGYIYYSDIYERCEINQIEVIPHYRNMKIGTKLMEYLIKTIKKNITLEVRIDNYYAIKLYEKFGFIKTAIRENYYNGVDGILMERLYNT